MLNILITGGSGYIGSHVATQLLLEKGHLINLTLLDKFANQNPLLISNKIENIEIDLSNESLTHSMLNHRRFDLVIHLAGIRFARLSEIYPVIFYQSNLLGTANLLSALNDSNFSNLIFASSCSVYGDSRSLVYENSNSNPVSVYAKTKLSTEFLIQDYAKQLDFNPIILRFFNVVGKSSFGNLDVHNHGLFPKILDCMNNMKPLTIFGVDHSTRDGTCLRDYLDVRDLVSAILRLVDSFIVGSIPKQIIYNLGTGVGHTVFEIVKIFEREYNKKIVIDIREKNEADPSAILANFDRFKNEFNWIPNQSIVDSIRSLF